ncbi:hypothetical protein AHF37_06609 [Paragonimus kellicotti]|nr:hypothetical protein AHF37_06609 [Paragonimus kellicotti]
MKPISTLRRLSELRKLLRARQLQAYIVPSEDEHFSEYVDPADKRCAFISGFTGSTCTAVVTYDKAALWTDGRYHFQAVMELDDSWTLMKKGLPDVPTEIAWLVKNTTSGARIGYDPKQMPFVRLKAYQGELIEAELTSASDNLDETAVNVGSRQLVSVDGPNLVDLVWDKMANLNTEGCERPVRLVNPIYSVSSSFAGQTWQAKVELIQQKMRFKRASVLVVSALDEIAWLLNLRGSDIQYNPVFFAHLIITLDEVHLFLNGGSIAVSQNVLKAQFNSQQIGVTIHPYFEFFEHLETVLVNVSKTHPRIWLSHNSNYSTVSRVPESQRLITTSPIAEMKAVKHPSELEGIRQAHLVDSLVLCDYLAWLDEIADRNRASHVYSGPMRGDLCDAAGLPALPAPEHLTEASAASYLDALRLQSTNCISQSFTTISGADGNSSVIHYHPTVENCAPLTASSLYLVDSGGQYQTGTTDVTRTVHLHQPTLEQKACYTLVLKAHIAVSSQVSFHSCLQEALRSFCCVHFGLHVVLFDSFLYIPTYHWIYFFITGNPEKAFLRIRILQLA